MKWIIFRKIGKSKIDSIKHPNDPSNVYVIAWCPSPWCKSLCPGNTLSACASSGAPKYIDGIESKKEWVIATLRIKIAINIGWKFNGKEIIRTAIRLTCIPGIKPVMVPASIPNVIARSICKYILGGVSGISKSWGQNFEPARDG